MAFAATGLLLLLSMVNVANLLLARGTARTREMAVRAALGATRRNLFVQTVSESLSLPVRRPQSPAARLRGGARNCRASAARRCRERTVCALISPVLLFAAALMIVAGLVVGLAPLLTMGAGRVAAVMNEGGRAALQGRMTRRVLAGMVVAEIALAIALVAGAGRLLLSMRNLVTIDPGFTSAGRLAIDVRCRCVPTCSSLLAW